MPHPKNLLFLKQNKALSYLWQEVQKLSALQHLFCDLYFSRKIWAKENKLAKHPFLLNKQIVHNKNRLQFFMTRPVNVQCCDGKTWIDYPLNPYISAPSSLYFSSFRSVGLFFLNKFCSHFYFCFWQCWIFSAVCGLFLSMVSRGCSLWWCAGLSLQQLLLQTVGSRYLGFSICSSRALEGRLSSCGTRAWAQLPVACRIFLDQG